MKRFYRFIWDECDAFYQLTGLRIQAPIELFFPDFGPWLFSKMTGIKGKKVSK